MSYIKRNLEKHLLYMATKYPIVTLTGPRQAGKSTLVQHAFPEKPYISCENPDIQLFADQDPRGFNLLVTHAVVFAEDKGGMLFLG